MIESVSTSLIAATVAVGCTLLVVFEVATAPPFPGRRVATAEERAEAAETIAANERTWDTETAQNFPADHWSQRDDFHGREYRKVLEVRREKDIRIEDVLRAVDDDIHNKRATRAEDADLRNARAVPCKPRPVYD